MENSNSSFYDEKASSLIKRYESLTTADLHKEWLHLIPKPPGAVLDIGAGSGRDAAFFAREGYRVWAVEPSSKMRSEAQKIHPESQITWMDDRLPLLQRVFDSKRKFNLILASAVWMHLPPEEQARAMERVSQLLMQEGVLVISVRQGPDEYQRGYTPTSEEDLKKQSESFPLELIATFSKVDQYRRPNVWWLTMVWQRH